MSVDDQAFMRRALELAARGLYSTDPNPRVGCVIVREGVVVGEGWHERSGYEHAEVLALRAAGAAARGATAYVTLEPCAATGRTPPCTDALLQAGIARLIYAADDPNRRMAGGARLLAAAGIAVEQGLLADESRGLNPGFFKRHELGLPWVRVKLGASLDGRTALANGASRWITGEAARHDAQRYRARSSAVLSGVGTILADDPALNVRLEGASRQPLRVVLDSRWRTPPQARVLLRENAALVMGLAGEDARRDALAAAGAAVEILPGGASGVDLRACMQRLAQLEINEVWVEAGATLSGALLAQGLVDELVLYLAPCLLGHQARPLMQLPAIDALERRHALRIGECIAIGEDLRIVARVLERSAEER